MQKLKLKFNPSAVGEEKRRGPRYTPLSKRQDRPASRGPRTGTRDERPEAADVAPNVAPAPVDDARPIRIRFAFLQELDRRNAEPFLEQLTAVG